MGKGFQSAVKRGHFDFYLENKNSAFHPHPGPPPLKGEGISGREFLPFSSFPGERELMRDYLENIVCF